VRLAILIPDPGNPEDFAWTLDGEAEALRAAGATVDALPWTTGDDLGRYDLILPLVVWGYHLRFDQWLAFLDRLERDRLPVINAPPLLRWNSDKAYLHALNEAGIPSVPTIVVDMLDNQALQNAREEFGSEELVVKPLVSASAHGTHRLAAGAPVPNDSIGRRMMIQPWLKRITDAGEYSLILFDGVLSHCVSKVPKCGDFRVQPDYGSTIVDCPAPDGAEAIARMALAAAPAPATYARVDLVVGNDGNLQIMELELIEPALYLDHSATAGESFARSVLAAAKRLAQQPLAQG
jgi:glutathione synthase/RimK-type ligase-like ATP-grasp enzyme